MTLKPNEHRYAEKIHVDIGDRLGQAFEKWDYVCTHCNRPIRLRCYETKVSDGSTWRTEYFHENCYNAVTTAERLVIE